MGRLTTVLWVSDCGGEGGEIDNWTVGMCSWREGLGDVGNCALCKCSPREGWGDISNCTVGKCSWGEGWGDIPATVLSYYCILCCGWTSENMVQNHKCFVMFLLGYSLH